MERRRVANTNTLLIKLASAYCDSKPYLWSVFFGFRSGNKDYTEIILPHRVWIEFDDICESWR